VIAVTNLKGRVIGRIAPGPLGTRLVVDTDDGLTISLEEPGRRGNNRGNSEHSLGESPRPSVTPPAIDETDS
jgi:hypothetical protein